MPWSGLAGATLPFDFGESLVIEMLKYPRTPVPLSLGLGLAMAMMFGAPAPASDDDAEVIVEATEADLHYGEFYRTQQMIDLLGEELRALERTTPQGLLSDQVTEPANRFRATRDRYRALLDERERLLENLPLQKRGAYEVSGPRPFRFTDGTLEVTGSLQQSLGLSSPYCPDLAIGQLKASDFRQYNWAPVDNGFGTIVFWPIEQSLGSVPTQTFDGDWSGSTGAQFLGTVTATDGLQSHLAAGVFEFTLPTFTCDSVVYWGTTVRAAKQGPWTFDLDKGWLSTEWVYHEDPNGTGFPRSYAQGFSRVPDGLWGGTELPESEWKVSDRQDFNRSFEVRSGQTAKIYLGMSLGMFAISDGTIMTAFLDAFEFDYGITYFMVPK